MPSATQLIKQDHREVEQMFSRFEQNPSLDLARQICQELEVHTEAEEQAVYPDLKRLDEDMFEEAEHEHDEVDQLIQQVKRAGSNEVERVTSLMREMKQKVQHHVQEEENEVLPQMERSCGMDRMQQLGDAFASAKQQHQQQVSGPGRASFASSSTSKEQLLEKTKDELYEEAKKAEIPGRSSMNKDELAEELSKQ